MRTVRDAIDAHAAARPDAPCIVAPEADAILTYGELRRGATALGAYLAQQGIAPGAVVSFMLPNGIAAASVFLGAMHAGYVVSPVNLIAQDAQLEYTLAHSRTRLVFAAPEHVDRLRVLLQRAQSAAILRATDPDRIELTGGNDLPPAAIQAILPCSTSTTSSLGSPSLRSSLIFHV